MCNGGTIRYLVPFLNSCRKVQTTFVMLHEALPQHEYLTQMEEILTAITNASGGERFLMDFDVVSCKFETYRRIPMNIVVAAGRKKAGAVLAGIRGGLIDVLITDMPLASDLLRRIKLDGI